jgi:hypothetical protein
MYTWKTGSFAADWNRLQWCHGVHFSAAVSPGPKPISLRDHLVRAGVNSFNKANMGLTFRPYDLQRIKHGLRVPTCTSNFCPNFTEVDISVRDNPKHDSWVKLKTHHIYSYYVYNIIYIYTRWSPVWSLVLPWLGIKISWPHPMFDVKLCWTSGFLHITKTNKVDYTYTTHIPHILHIFHPIPFLIDASRWAKVGLRHETSPTLVTPRSFFDAPGAFWANTALRDRWLFCSWRHVKVPETISWFSCEVVKCLNTSKVRQEGLKE